MNKMPVTDFGKNACKWQYTIQLSHMQKLAQIFEFCNSNKNVVELHKYCLHFKFFNDGGCNSDSNGNLSLRQHCQVVV